MQEDPNITSSRTSSSFDDDNHIDTKASISVLPKHLRPPSLPPPSGPLPLPPTQMENEEIRARLAVPPPLKVTKPKYATTPHLFEIPGLRRTPSSETPVEATESSQRQFSPFLSAKARF